VSLPRLLRGTTPARVTLAALPVSVALGLLTPVWRNWWMGALSLFVWSIGYTLVAINSISYRQQVTPEHMLGRVNTAGRMLAWGLGWTGGALLAGVLSGLIGLRATLFTMAGLAAVGLVVAYTSPLVSRHSVRQEEQAV
jgi:MFS family permease